MLWIFLVMESWMVVLEVSFLIKEAQETSHQTIRQKFRRKVEGICKRPNHVTCRNYKKKHSNEWQSWGFPNSETFSRKSHLEHNITKLNDTNMGIFPFPSNIIVAKEVWHQPTHLPDQHGDSDINKSPQYMSQALQITNLRGERPPPNLPYRCILLTKGVSHKGWVRFRGPAFYAKSKSVGVSYS